MADAPKPDQATPKAGDSAADVPTLLGSPPAPEAPAADTPAAPPGGTAEPAKQEPEKKPEAKAEGAPEAYADFALPEGVQVDPGQLTKFSAIAKELNLSQDAAQQLVTLQAEYSLAQEKAAGEALRKQQAAWQAEVKKDPRHGEKLSAARKAVDAFADGATRDLLTKTWLGDHPAILAFLAKVGESISEDRLSGGDSAGAKRLPTADVLYGGKKR